MRGWWFSGLWRRQNGVVTVLVVVNGQGLIVEAPPIVRRFTGQHVSNLTRWLRSACTDVLIERVW